jgi:hypothetical protein
VHVAVPGFRTRVLDLVTTLLDAGIYTKKDLADLYRRRWEAEMSHPDYPSSDALYHRERAA